MKADIDARAREIAAGLVADRSRAGQDALIYIRGGKHDLAIEHDRRNLDKRATSRAVGAVSRKLRAVGLSPARWGTDAGALLIAVARVLAEGGAK